MTTDYNACFQSAVAGYYAVILSHFLFYCMKSINHFFPLTKGLKHFATKGEEKIIPKPTKKVVTRTKPKTTPIATKPVVITKPTPKKEPKTRKPTAAPKVTHKVIRKSTKPKLPGTAKTKAKKGGPKKGKAGKGGKQKPCTPKKSKRCLRLARKARAQG